MQIVLISCAFLVGCASAQYVKSGVKGGYGGQQHEYRGGDNLVKIFGNVTQHGYNTSHTNLYNIDYERGVCYQEVPTASLVRDPAHVPTGNGSRPDLSRIRGCCHGYIKNIYNYKICEPVCTKECVNALCTAPETCSCYPDHVKNAAGICVATCPIGCQNGHCAGGECLCKEGFRLDIEGKFCVPICRGNCGGIGNCTSPNTCVCTPGYQSTPDGSCTPAGSGCGPCTNGDCVSNECRCHQGYQKDQRGLCVPQCSRICGPGQSCISPNVCSYSNTGIPSNTNLTSIPLNQSSNYPYPHNQGSNQFFNPYNSDSNLPSYPHGYRPTVPQQSSNHSTYPNQNPGQNPNQYPGQNPYQYPSQNPNQYPGQNPNQYPGQNHNQYPGQNHNHNPGQHPNQYPGQNPNQYPDQNPNQYPGQNANPSYPNQNPGYNPNPNSENPSHPNQGSSYHNQGTNNPSYPNQGSNHPSHPDQGTNYPLYPNQNPNSPNQGSQYTYPNNQGPSQPINGSHHPSSSNPDMTYVVNTLNQPGYPTSLNQVVNSSYSHNQSNYSSMSNQSSNPSYPSNQGSSASYPSHQGSSPYNPSNQGSNSSYPSNQGSNPSFPSGQDSNPSYPSNQGSYPYSPSNQNPNPSYPSHQGQNPTYPSSPKYPYYNQGSNPYTTQGPNSYYPYSSNNDCGQPCINGVCYAGRCICLPGYELDRTDTTGHTCQRPKPTGCVMECISPDVCICKMGYHRPPGVKA